MHAALDTDDLEELLGVAEQISRRLGYPSGGEWRRWLRETIGELKAEEPGALKTLRDLTVPIATTNYDSLLEEAMDWPAVTWREGPQVERVLRGDDEGVLHLHGHWRDPESVVLGIRSYDAVLSDAHAQTVLRSLRLRHTLVFIGCGAGLGDPNLGALLAWSRPILGGSEYRHFRLCRKQEREELEQQHPIEERIFPLPFGEKHEDLAPFLRNLAPRRRSKKPAKSRPQTVALPPRPARCIGREQEVEALVGALLAGERTPVLGPAGIGKSTICLVALHDLRVAKRFGNRRYFVRCDKARSLDELTILISSIVGSSGKPDFAAGIADSFKQKATALVLDNLETQWWIDTEATEEMLASLAAISKIALLVSLRGHQRPLKVSWSKPVFVKPLKDVECRDLFLKISGLEEEPRLDELIRRLDGLPLAVELLAHAAEAEPNLEGIWDRWNDKRDMRELFTIDSEERNASLFSSLEMSIWSRRMNDEARRLLSCLSRLPEGIPNGQLKELLPRHGYAAASRLRKVSLAYQEGDRLMTSAPLREHVAALYPPSQDDLQRIKAMRDLNNPDGLHQ